MTTLAKVDVGRSWTLVYDAVASGGFTGAVCALGGKQAAYHIASGAPVASDAGMATANWISVSLSQNRGDKLYARSADDSAIIVMDDALAPEAFKSGVWTTEDESTRRLKTAINPELIGGEQAVTTQLFTELNVKAGNQHEASMYTPDATVENIYIVTGIQPVIIKAFLIQIDGDGLQYQLFEGPTATQGTEILNYNLRADSTNSSETKIYEASSVTDAGTPVSPLITLIGNTNPGVAAAPISTEGLERVLAPNTTYLLNRESLTTAQSQRSALYMTWYEGPLSTDQPAAL